LKRELPIKSVTMKISPYYTVEDWNALDFSREQDWLKAINIFEDRIKGRFFEFIDKIKKFEFGGFAVMALDCLLIETLQQFYEGKARTPERESKKYFKNFLTRGVFKDYFKEKMPDMFYEQVRNGILHQAEIKGNSKIHIRKCTPLVSFTCDKKGLIINRMLFHEQLVKEFKEYLSRLKNPKEKKLRDNFKKKMNYVCRITLSEF